MSRGGFVPGPQLRYSSHLFRAIARGASDIDRSETRGFAPINHELNLDLLIARIPLIKWLDGGLIIAVLLERPLHRADAGGNFLFGVLLAQNELAGIHQLVVTRMSRRALCQNGPKEIVLAGIKCEHYFSGWVALGFHLDFRKSACVIQRLHRLPDFVLV